MRLAPGRRWAPRRRRPPYALAAFGAMDAVPLRMIGERLRCSEARVGLLLGGVVGVVVNRQEATARIADPELAAAIKHAFADEHDELRPLARMGAEPAVPHPS